jgi:LPS O-antigen subunit length determinant protein (WzzB/FepE family)
MHQQVANGEIDLRESLLALWKGKWIIILLTAVFAVGGAVYAFSLTDIYQAKVVLVPSINSDQDSYDPARFNGVDSKVSVLSTLHSREFIIDFIRKHNLQRPITTAQGWDAGSDTLIFSDKQVAGNELEQSDLSVRTAYNILKSRILNINESRGDIIISFNFYSPSITYQWANWFIDDFYSWMKSKSLAETQRNIHYLKDQLQTVEAEGMRSVYYQLLGEQIRTKMLAKVDSEYAFKVIQPAVMPGKPVKPKKALICVWVTLLGVMFGVTIVLARLHLVKVTSNK